MSVITRFTPPSSTVASYPAQSLARASATASVPSGGSAVELGKLARWTVKGDGQALDQIPAPLRSALHELVSDASISDSAKDLLYFNLVLRPMSEFRDGSEIAPRAEAGRSAWANYLSSLQAMNLQSMMMRGNNFAALNELQGLYARAQGAL